MPWMRSKAKNRPTTFAWVISTCPSFQNVSIRDSGVFGDTPCRCKRLPKSSRKDRIPLTRLRQFDLGKVRRVSSSEMDKPLTQHIHPSNEPTDLSSDHRPVITSCSSLWGFSDTPWRGASSVSNMQWLNSYRRPALSSAVMATFKHNVQAATGWISA